ncbi:hypothetical protein ACFCV9_08535 [Streptomyces sp. NPDC056367]|uniref:hypothetical protein n=1 Tax=Streptomyces sp. NPDC056367 TaxID=3345797 RepID=UPI0035D8963B
MAASPTARERPVTAPESLGDYRLLTGDAAARAEAAVLAGRRKPDIGRFWYYDKDGDEVVHALFLARSTVWDPELRGEKERDSVSQEFRNFFAGAKAHDVREFAPGPDGGGLSCGYTTGPDGDRAICAWSGAATFGVLRLADPTGLPDAARLALALRTTSKN